MSHGLRMTPAFLGSRRRSQPGGGFRLVPIGIAARLPNSDQGRGPAECFETLTAIKHEVIGIALAEFLVE